MNSDLLFFRLGALKNLVDATASRWLKAAMRDWKHFMARKILDYPEDTSCRCGAA